LKHAHRLYHLARADFYERVRRHGFLVALLFCVYAGYGFAELSRRMTRIFLKGSDGRRPVHGANRLYHEDPNWQDQILFYEYFHGDNGAGLGASHQTGWTGVIARLMHVFATTTAADALASRRPSLATPALPVAGAALAEAPVDEAGAAGMPGRAR
jgi:hypothetical protein